MNEVTRVQLTPTSHLGFYTAILLFSRSRSSNHASNKDMGSRYQPGKSPYSQIDRSTPFTMIDERTLNDR